MHSSLTFTPLEPHLDELVEKTFPGRRQLRCEGYVVTEGFKQIADDILNMEVREDDTWVCTYPKSGTTWTEELVWCLANDMDFNEAKAPQLVRFPYLELEHFFQSIKDKQFSENESFQLDPRNLTHSVEVVKNMKSPRFIKTHLPVRLLPLQIQRGTVKPKIVHVYRNPMDCCISYFHHNRLMMGYKGKLEDFATLFIKDAVLFTPFWKHYLEYLEMKNDFNILYLNYEDMIKDFPTAVRRTAAFLNKRITENQVGQLCDYLSFNNMKNNPSSNNEDIVKIMKMIFPVQSDGSFMRKGTAGQWKSNFSPEWLRRIQEWTDENLQGTGFSCNYVGFK